MSRAVISEIFDKDLVAQCVSLIDTSDSWILFANAV